MEFAGTVEIAAPREKVFAFLNDPRQVGSCGPGVESIEVIDETHFVAKAKVGVGFISARFTINAEVAERVAPERATVGERASERVRPGGRERSAPIAIPVATLLPLRLFLGGMLLYAGVDKLLDPAFLQATGPGSIGEQLVAGWFAAKGLDVLRTGDSEADRVIDGKRVEIKVKPDDPVRPGDTIIVPERFF